MQNALLNKDGTEQTNKCRITLPGLSEVALNVGANTGVEPGTCIVACFQSLTG
jgi:hypothetical protein